MRVCVIGHRRSGCHFFIKSIKKNFKCEEIIKSHHLGPDHRARIERIYLWRLPNLKDGKIYIVRDGRDVMVSFYYWCKEAGEFRNEWAPLVPRRDWNTFHEFIQSPVFIHQNLEFGECPNPVEYWKLHVESWLRTDIARFRYEDLHRHPRDTLKAIGLHLGLVPKERADFDKIKRLVGYMPRKGVIGDWRNHFSEEDLEFFDGICGDLMRTLGYYERDARGKNEGLLGLRFL